MMQVLHAGITPVLGWATIRLPFTPLAFGTGLTIFCIMPTTLGVGVSLVTSAKVALTALHGIMLTPDASNL